MIVFRMEKAKQEREKIKTKGKIALVFTAILCLLLILVIVLAIIVDFSISIFAGLIVTIIAIINYKFLFSPQTSDKSICITETEIRIGEDTYELVSNVEKVIAFEDKYIIYSNSGELTCKRNLMVEGTTQEFEQIFSDKIIKE